MTKVRASASGTGLGSPEGPEPCGLGPPGAIPDVDMAFELLIPAGATAKEAFAIVWGDTSKTRAELERCIIDERDFHAKRYSAAMAELDRLVLALTNIARYARRNSGLGERSDAGFALIDEIARTALTQGIEARSAETAGLGPKGESAVGNADAP